MSTQRGQNLKGKKVVLIQGGFSPEKEISRKTSQCVEKVLKTLPCSYFVAEADGTLLQQLQDEKPDLAFLGVHGVYGEDGSIQSLCEFLKIPYTGSGILASALCMDKLFFKNLLLKNKIATPDFTVIHSLQNIPPLKKYPVVIKASHGGSTLGTHIVQNSNTLSTAFEKAKNVGRYVFIEEYISQGMEVAVSYLNSRILTPVEIVPKNGFYDYKHKYEIGQTDYILPPRLNPMVVEKIKVISEKVISLTDVRGYARLDFIVKEDAPWLLELNTLPGLTETSLLPKSAKKDGLNFPQVIEMILSAAALDYSSVKTIKP